MLALEQAEPEEQEEGTVPEPPLPFRLDDEEEEGELAPKDEGENAH